MLDPNILNTPKIEQLYPYERLEDLVALLYDVNLKSKRGFSFDTSEAQLKLEHDSLLADLSANPSFQETLSNAIEAVKATQIIMDSRWLNEDEIDITKANKDTQVKTITFFFWAEQENITIPKNLIGALDLVFLDHSNEQAAIKKEIATFPPLSREEFDKRLNKPLWYVYEAWLYCLGIDVISDDISYIAEYVKKGVSHTNVILEQIDNAVLTKLISAYDGHIPEATPEFHKKLLRKVKPKEFVDLLQSITTVTFLEDTNKIRANLNTNYTTPQLNLLLSAVEKFWGDFDMEMPNPHNAPYKKDVTEWLLSEAKKGGFPLSKTLAESMDTIIRHASALKGGNSL